MKPFPWRASRVGVAGLIAALLTGCAVEFGPSYPPPPPPPPPGPVVVLPPPPPPGPGYGYRWIPGHYGWRGGYRVWIPGHYRRVWY